MHPEVLGFFRRHFPPEAQRGKSVLEVGSLDTPECGGSLRQVISEAREYVGLDMRPGPGVDVEGMAESYRPGYHFDVVVSAGTLEHCKNWRAVAQNIKYLAKPNGLILVTTVAPGFHRHNHPDDYWRWTKPQLALAFSDCYIKALEGEGYDVFLKAIRPPVWEPIDIQLCEATPLDF